MYTHCASCGEAFRSGDYIQALPPVLQLREGDKSGQLGWYPEGNPETDYVHIECVQGYYQVEDTPVWDEIETNIRDSVRHEERELMHEEALKELTAANGLICKECLEEIEPEDAVVLPKTQDYRYQQR